MGEDDPTDPPPPPPAITCSISLTLSTNTLTTTSISTPCLYTHPALRSPSMPYSGSTETFDFNQNNTRPQNNLMFSQNNTTLTQNNTGFTQNNTVLTQNGSTHSLNNDRGTCPSWQVVRNKRKSQDHGNSQFKLKLVKTTEVPTTSSNYFSPLAMVQDDQIVDSVTQTTTQTNNKNKVNPNPPPVFIHGVTNYQEMISSILTVVKEEDYVCRSLANNVVKINPKTIDSYRALVRYLRSQNIVFHTYQAKQDKSYRVVIRHIHHSVPTDQIKDELEFEGFKVRNITNVLKRSTKDPLNLFFVDLEPADNNKKIYELQYLMHMKIAVEPPRKNASIAQCTRCQNYGHTKAYCTRPYACVKCGGNHSSSTCNKTRETPATCALCDGPHPANYRGCTVYKDLQDLRSSRNIQPRQPDNIPSASQTHTHVNNLTQNTTNTRNTQSLSYARVTRSNQPTLHASQSTSSTNNSSVITLSTFLTEFKSMFNQLLSQNSMIITMLTTVISKLIPK